MSPTDIWVFSNGLGGVAFAVLTVLLIVSRHGRVEGLLLTIACGINALWALILTVAPAISMSGPALDLVETLRDGAWLVFIAWLLPMHRFGRGWLVLRWSTLVLPLTLAVFLLWRMLMVANTAESAQRSIVFALGAATMALWGMVLLEQLYRSADIDERWGVKYICLGVGALFAYDFLMYSYAFLHRQIDINVWDARGAVNALVVPLIAVSVGRNPTWSPSLRLSHQAAFHTGAMVVGGAYLLFISLVGYYIRHFGGSWSNAFGVLFLVAMLLLFSIVLLSGQARARAKVLMKKHFFSYKYDYRAEWLGLTRRLTEASETADPYQRSIRAVAHILECPAGALWLKREGVFVCVSHWNMVDAMDISETSDTPLIAFLRENRWIVDLDQYRNAPAHYGHLAVPDWLMDLPRARLVIPLFFEPDLLGFMLLAVPRAHYALTWEDLDLLKTLGSQVGSFLGQQESHHQLAQARQFETFNRLTAFLMHDLKNIAAQQSLIVQNAKRHKRNPEFVDDMIMTADSSVHRMKRLLEQLQRTNAQHDDSRRVDVGALLQQVVDELQGQPPAPTLETHALKVFVRADPERFGMILGHVIRNAQEATAAEGHVAVELQTEGAGIQILVQDNGEGMSAAFIRDSLFKPFYSTKSTRGMGIGAYQARDFARTAGGDVQVVSQPGEGTTFTITLPAASGSERAGRSFQDNQVAEQS